MSEQPHVLLVEDDELVSDTLCTILEEDYEVSCVGSTEQALAEIAGRQVHVVLLDYHLADGDGAQVADSSTMASVPVIWMTGDPEAVQGLPGGSRRILRKPFGIEALRRALVEALVCRTGGAALAGSGT